MAKTKRKRVAQAVQGAAYSEIKRSLDTLKRDIDFAAGETGPKTPINQIVEAFLVFCLTRSKDDQLKMIAEGQEIVRQVIESRDEPGPELTPADAIAKVIIGLDQPGAGASVGNPGKGKNRKGRRNSQELRA